MVSFSQWAPRYKCMEWGLMQNTTSCKSLDMLSPCVSEPIYRDTVMRRGWGELEGWQAEEVQVKE